jgi:hypothetical protein
MSLRPLAPLSWTPPPLLLSPGAAARRWSVAALTRSRRNAMVAATALAERRAEREEAEAFVEEAARRYSGALPQPRRASHGS